MCVKGTVDIKQFGDIYQLIIVFYFLRKREEK